MYNLISFKIGRDCLALFSHKKMQLVFSECLLWKAGKHLGEGEINCKVVFDA